MKNHVRVNRLKRHHKMLGTVKEKRFNMLIWAESNAACQVNLSCGSAACALGWEASQSYARRAGLRLVVSDAGCPHPEYKECLDDYAGAVWFGITLKESSWLFSPEEYGRYLVCPINKSKVRARVKKLYRHYEKHNAPLKP